MDNARYGALVVSCCLMLNVCILSPLSAQIRSTTGQQSPSAALPQTLDKPRHNYRSTSAEIN